MYSLGLDIGSTSLKAVVIDSDRKVVFRKYTLHRGTPLKDLEKVLEEISQKYGSKITRGAISGKRGDLLSQCHQIRTVNPIASLVEGSLFINPDIKAISEIGGQSAKYITGFSDSDRRNVEFSINESCSAGTGSFLEEQASRLNFKIEDYASIAQKAKSTPRIAGRCSVFAKTDITHHQQEGTPIPDILKGLAYGVIKNYRNSVMKKLPGRVPLLLCGGVSKNETMVEAFREITKTAPSDLIMTEHSHVIAALGAAVIAAEEEIKLDFSGLTKAIKKGVIKKKDNKNRMTPLKEFGIPMNGGLHRCITPEKASEPIPCWLGIDVGSTSTNLILIDERNQVLGYRYLRTAGDPVKAVQSGLLELEEEFGEKISISGAGTTGSGRYLAGRLTGADLIKDEITSQARAATMLDPEVDTIFEIGGQDSKFISIEKGQVRDFQMNKVCAAGTGSFIEEQALKLNIPIEKYGEVAFRGNSPTDLGERCTVFMESRIATSISEGESTENIASGLCYSIVNNYLNKVVGHRKIGKRIVFQGGLAWNPGVINAFKAVTRKDIKIAPFFSVTGAYGVAILTKESMEKNQISSFRGFKPVLPHRNLSSKKRQLPEEDTFTKKIHKFLFRDYDEKQDPAKMTVGIPRALFTYGMFPMFYPFFRELGFNVVLSDNTSEKTIELAQKYSIGETCYPVKLINGHVADLVEKKVDYIFFPDLHTVHHPDSKSRQNYGCAYMQLAFKLVNQAMNLEKKGIALLAPTIAFSMGKEFMMDSFARLGEKMGRGREETLKALKKAMMSYQDFDAEMEKRQKKTLKELDPDKKTFVMISKIYGVADPILNMSIPEKLIQMGYQVIPFYEMPGEDIFKDYPNMYWPFGQHILEAARGTKSRDNFYAVYLSHHGCGPDTAASQYIKEIMGDKPYLNIEIDEHASEVGIMTRVEAFVNSIEGYEAARKPKETLYIPEIYPYSQIAGEIMSEEGHEVKIMRTSGHSMREGRKHGDGNEYFSFICLLGDVLTSLKERQQGGPSKIVIPENEGAEVDGQYGRIIWSKLKELKIESARIESPYMEDMLGRDDCTFWKIYMALLAGDLVMVSSPSRREDILSRVRDLVKSRKLSLYNLRILAREIREAEQGEGDMKIIALGEPPVLFNSQMNGEIFKTIEERGYRVAYGSMSEAMWLFWKDFMRQKGSQNSTELKHLEEMREGIIAIGDELKELSCFSNDLDGLAEKADQTVGLYAGAFGRYREARTLTSSTVAKGVITVSSMYENTGISLNSLQRQFRTEDSLPCLNLTFDGTDNSSNKEKIDSFLYYLS